MAMPQNMEELNAAIAAKIREAFPDKQIEDIGKLHEFFPGMPGIHVAVRGRAAGARDGLDAARRSSSATRARLANPRAEGGSDKRRT